MRGLDGASGAWTRLTGTQDVGRLRLGGSLRAERIVGRVRDAADLMVTAGASLGVEPWAGLVSSTSGKIWRRRSATGRKAGRATASGRR